MADYYWRSMVETQLRQILANQEKIMSGLTDLNAATAALETEVTTILADIQTALAGDDPDAAVEAASVIVKQAVANLTAGDPLNATPPVPPVVPPTT